MTYQPKGGMCCACKNALRDCSSLPFKDMQKLERDGERVIVRCYEFKRSKTKGEYI